MIKRLKVYLNEEYTGQLLLDKGKMVFEYDKSWLNSSVAVPLSHSLPLKAERFNIKECQPFFAGLLPEESKRQQIAKNLGISKGNDFALLERIGGECAGGVTLIPPDDPPPSPKNYELQILTENELQQILIDLPQRPLLAGEKGVRLSLAGAQDKITVNIKDNIISIPLNGAPSTHILKPGNLYFEGLIFNEAYCVGLAKVIGLPVAEVAPRSAGAIEYLEIKRYDRYLDSAGNIQRIHQEDFCQALGVRPENKYEEEGGPSLKECFNLIREVASKPVIDIPRFIDAVIFNLLIGNHDAHGKNFSLLYKPGSIELAPLYDLISTVYYPKLSPTMAMKISKERHSEKITLKHFEILAKDAQISLPLIKRRLQEITGKVLANVHNVPLNHPVAEQVATIVERRCRRLLA